MSTFLALTALRKIWSAYTLERAVAGACSSSEQAYRDVSLDKAEVLAELRRVRQSVARTGGHAARPC